MARWRDIKKGDIQNKSYKTTINNTATTSCCNVPLLVRFKAFITDTFMLTMPLIYIVFYFVMGSREEFALHKMMGWVYILMPHFILIFSLWYFKQQTPGLKAYELSLVDSNTGQKPSVVSLINRYIQTLISIFLILPLFYPYINKQKKTFQDILSGTCIKHTPTLK
jgi:uncharacterized RDD family membrane protein YckC